MIRRQYQERFLKKELDKLEQIKHVEKEIDDVFYLFEELYQTTNNSQKNIDTIEETITSTKQEITITNTLIDEAKYEEDIGLRYKYLACILAGEAVIGVGFVCSSYVGFGTFIGGCVVATLSTVYTFFT
jgi:t-SNARE complex subunit (syntaxin)